MLSCDNPFVNYVAFKAVDNGMTFIWSNLHYIRSIYNVLDNKIMVHRDSVVNACIILELVNVKDGKYVIDSLCLNEICELINFCAADEIICLQFVFIISILYN